MDIVYTICMLFAGIGTFLIGCKFLSDNMEKLANSKIKSLFNKTSNSKIAGVGIGTATTALVQSSGLTTVMVVGFVNAGMITLFQATALIMGANIGTTVTAQIASLQSFSISQIAVSFAGIGVFMSLFGKKEKVKIIGNILAGLGLVFVGLHLMTSSMEGLKESQMLIDILEKVKNPLLLLFIGIVFTALLNSSSAVTSLIISMAAAGIMIGGGGNSVLFIILGSNIGSCVTALLSSIGTNVNAKRASIIHLMFNVFGSTLFFILLVCWPSFMNMTFAKWFKYETNQIAMFHTFFNVTCTVIFIPFVNMFVKLSEKIIKDKKGEEIKTFLDKRFLASPAIAVDAVIKETIMMLDKAVTVLDSALKGFIDRDENNNTFIHDTNTRIIVMSKNITNYLIQISAVEETIKLEQYVSAMHSNNGDIVRISELADNLVKYTAREIQEDLIFSNIVKEQLTEMMNNIKNLYDVTSKIILDKELSLVSFADEIEDKIDHMRKELINGHIARLNTGECKSESSSVFINLVGNLERAGDHLSFVAHSTDSIK